MQPSGTPGKHGPSSVRCSATSERPTRAASVPGLCGSPCPTHHRQQEVVLSGQTGSGRSLERTSIRRRVELLVTPREQYVQRRPRWLELRFGLSIVSTFCVSTVIVLLGWVLIPTLFVAWNASAIESGSMEPAIERGDVVVFQPAQSSPLASESVIRFRLSDSEGTVVHRIVDHDAASDVYTTQGDANPTVDSDLVPFEQIEGVGALLVPLIGYPLLWVQERQYLFLVLTALGSALVLVSSQTAPTNIAADSSAQLHGPLTPAHSVAAQLHTGSLFPADFESLGSLQAVSFATGSFGAVILESQSVAEQPVAGQPVAEQPVAVQPVAVQSVAVQPAAVRFAAASLTKEQSAPRVEV